MDVPASNVKCCTPYSVLRTYLDLPKGWEGGGGGRAELEGKSTQDKGKGSPLARGKVTSISGRPSTIGCAAFARSDSLSSSKADGVLFLCPEMVLQEITTVWRDAV